MHFRKEVPSSHDDVGYKSKSARFAVAGPPYLSLLFHCHMSVTLWPSEQCRNRSLVHTEASFYLAELTLTNMEWYAALFISPWTRAETSLCLGKKCPFRQRLERFASYTSEHLGWSLVTVFFEIGGYAVQILQDILGPNVNISYRCHEEFWVSLFQKIYKHPL